MLASRTCHPFVGPPTAPLRPAGSPLRAGSPSRRPHAASGRAAGEGRLGALGPEISSLIAWASARGWTGRIARSPIRLANAGSIAPNASARWIMTKRPPGPSSARQATTQSASAAGPAARDMGPRAPEVGRGARLVGGEIGRIGDDEVGRLSASPAARRRLASSASATTMRARSARPLSAAFSRASAASSGSISISRPPLPASAQQRQPDGADPGADIGDLRAPAPRRRGEQHGIDADAVTILHLPQPQAAAEDRVEAGRSRSAIANSRDRPASPSNWRARSRSSESTRMRRGRKPSEPSTALMCCRRRKSARRLASARSRRTRSARDHWCERLRSTRCLAAAPLPARLARLYGRAVWRWQGNRPWVSSSRSRRNRLSG